MTPRIPLAALAAAIPFLTACSSWRAPQEPSAGVLTLAGRNVAADRPAAASVDAGLSWAYRIEGNRAIRPSQVFAYRGATYLLMRPGQELPVVLVNGMPARFDVFPPYIVVRGMPARIDLVVDGYRVIIQRS